MHDLIIQNHTILSHNITGIDVSNHQINIKKGFDSSVPIRILVLDASYQTIEIDLEESVEASIHLDFNFSLNREETVRVHLNLFPNAHCEWMTVGRSKGEKLIIMEDAILKQDAKLAWTGLNLNEKNQTQATIHLNAQGAEVDFKSLTVSSDYHQQILDSKIIHHAPHTRGDMYHIGIANQQGKIELNGIGKIEKGMKQASSFQTLKGVILSHQAMIEVNPFLLIDEYDVKAGHGATVGKIDEEMLYYMQSRGLSLSEAERLILLGHIHPILNTIQDEPLKEHMLDLIKSRL